METGINNRVLLSLSLTLIALLVAVSGIGLFYPSFYVGATPNWEIQTRGQDAVDLFLVVPVLISTLIYSYERNRFAWYMWGATNAYIVYTFAIYCFAVKFNALFVPYCLIFGLSFFSTGAFVFSIVRENVLVQLPSSIRKLTGYFLILQATLFYITWLADILPAVFNGSVPADVAEAGLMTNPVHVIDLAIALPLIFAIGVLTLKGSSIAINFVPSILVFFILMDIAIAVLAAMLFKGGLTDSYSVVIIMSINGLLSLAVLIYNLAKVELTLTARVWNLR
jgi:hypothetical protein